MSSGTFGERFFTKEDSEMAFLRSVRERTGSGHGNGEEEVSECELAVEASAAAVHQ